LRDEVTAPEPNHYRARFVVLADRTLQHLLAEIQAGGDALPDVEIRERVMYALEQAISHPSLWPTVRQVFTVMAPRIEQAGNWDEWIELFEAALARSQAEADRAGEALLYYHLGILYRLQARYADADQAFTTSAERYSELGDATGRAMVQSRHAYLAWTQRDFGRAHRLAEEGLSQVLPEPEGGDVHAYSHLVLGVLALELYRWQELHDHSQSAYLFWHQSGNRHLAAKALSNQALALQQMQQYEEAIEIYRQALELYDAIEDTTGWAIAQMNLGILHRRQYSYDVALACYRQAEEIFRRTANSLLLARIYNNEGKVYCDLGRWQEGEVAYLLSIECWQALDNLPEQINTLDNLIDLLLSQGRDDEAKLRLGEATVLLSRITHDPAYERLAAYLREKQEQLHKKDDQG
jgi:tetratricopeptide (TPR) repeat protein